jgi:hypothetical protein
VSFCLSVCDNGRKPARIFIKRVVGDLTQYCAGDKIEKDEMGGACGVYGGEERRIEGFGVETRGKRDNTEGPGVDGRIILRWFFRKWYVGVWTGLGWLRIGTGGG